jgi:hypothetical protein
MQTDPVLDWQARNLPALRRLSFGAPCCGGVTLLAPWFWADERFDGLLDHLLAAVLMTWRACGRLPVVLLVNRETPALQRMAGEWGLRLLLESSIKGGGGSIGSVNRRGLERLAGWFDTEYVLSFQHHAFAIRPGLEAFVGPYDFIGAPWRFDQDDWITRLLLPRRGHVGNTAFALRSRRICEMAAWYYRRKYKFLPYCYLLNDDFFYGKVLPSWEPRYRRTMRIAPPEVAATFALETNVTLHKALGARPFGFHGPEAFRVLLDEGQVPDLP